HSGISLVQMIASCLVTYTWAIRNTVWPLGNKYLNAAWFAVILGLAFWGYLKRVRSGITVLEIFAVVYLGMIVIVPWPNSRYIIPLVPLLLLYVAEAVGPTAKKGVSVYTRTAPIALLVLLTASTVWGYTALSFKPILESYNNPDFMAASAFLRDKTP